MINDGIDVSILCGKVVVKPGIRSFTRDDVIFADLTRAQNVDVVIFATGYQHHFPFLQSTSKASFADCGRSESRAMEDGELVRSGLGRGMRTRIGRWILGRMGAEGMEMDTNEDRDGEVN